MKNPLLALLGFILLSTPLAATAQQYGDFTYTSDGSVIAITGYTGPGGAVTIPASISGRPVVAIWYDAFYDTSLTSVTIPSSIVFIGDGAFEQCLSLTNVTIPGSVTNIGNGGFAGCGNLTGVIIPGSVTDIGDAAFYECWSLANVTIPSSVTSIRTGAFTFCPRLTSVTIPASVTSIGDGAFSDCISVKGIFFKGDAPSSASDVFFGDNNATVYYLPGTTGWGPTFGGAPTSLWNPLMQSSGVGLAGFGFNITGTADIPIVIEAATNLANSMWVPLQSLDLTNGAFYFSDPNWTNHPAHFYRIRSP